MFLNVFRDTPLHIKWEQNQAVPGIWNILNAFALYSSITLADEMWLSVLRSSMFKPQEVVDTEWSPGGLVQRRLVSFGIACEIFVSYIMYLPWRFSWCIVLILGGWEQNVTNVAKIFLPYNKTNAEIHLCLEPFLRCPSVLSSIQICIVYLLAKWWL